MIFGKQDTHVPRAGRDLIRKVLEDANVACSVGPNIFKKRLELTVRRSSSRCKPSMRLSGTSRVRDGGMQH